MNTDPTQTTTSTITLTGSPTGVSVQIEHDDATMAALKAAGSPAELPGNLILGMAMERSAKKLSELGSSASKDYKFPFMSKIAKAWVKFRITFRGLFSPTYVGFLLGLIYMTGLDILSQGASEMGMHSAGAWKVIALGALIGLAAIIQVIRRIQNDNKTGLL